MKKLRQFIWAAVIIGSVLTPSATAAESFSVLLQKGIFAEETEGNLDAAIKIYQQITAEAATDRSVVAQAQYRLGVCYQKQGNKEQAVNILNDLLKQFPAEAALGQKARDLLAGLGQIPSSNITIRQLPLTAGVIYSVSPDGRLVAYNKASAYNNAMEDNNVVIYETATGKTWTVNKRNEDGWEHVIFSPDGRLVAYHLIRSEDWSSAVYVARIGSEAKQVYECKKNANIWLYDWSPDGGQLIVGIWDAKNTRVASVGTLDIKTGTLKEIKRVTPFARTLGHVCLSSNGRYLAYRASAGTENQRKISVIDLESATETTLVEREVGDIVGWSPEDAKLLFSSSRTGTIGLWAITVREGKPSGDPELVKANLGDISPLGLTRDGTFYYTEAKSSKDTDIYLATANFQTGEISGQPRRVMDRFLGVQSLPVWSKDGQKLMMVANSRQKLFVAVSMASGEQKEYPVWETSTMNLPPLPQYEYAWSPDGSFLLMESGIVAGKQGILRYELASGTTEMLVTTMNAQQIRFYHPRFSPDGNSFYYTRRHVFKGADELTDWKDSIIRRNLRSGNEEIVYDSPEKLQPRSPYELSPDGERLAIVASVQFPVKAKDFVVALKVRGVSGSETKELVRMAPRVNVTSLAWTPDGKRLVYTKVLRTGNYAGGPTEVWATAVDSGQSVELKFSPSNIQDISIHPDGRQIAFSAGLPDESAVWVMEGLMPKPVAPTARTTNK